VPLWAHDEARPYLARARQYSLDEEECAQLIQVVLGHGGRSDEAKARRRARMDANMARRKGDARPVLSRVGRSRPWREMKKPRPRSDRGELANRGTGWPG
jgi:hypothetical protein